MRYTLGKSLQEGSPDMILDCTQKHNASYARLLGERSGERVVPLRETLEKQSDDGHFLQYHICGTKGVIETDVFKRRIRRFLFSDADDGLENKIVETITFPKELDQEYFHNTHGQNLRVIELAAKGLPPEVPASDAFATMLLCFAAERSEDTGRIIRLDDLPQVPSARV